MRGLTKFATIVAVGLSLGGCMTDKEAAQATPEQKRADKSCDTTKAVAALPGLVFGLGGAFVTSAVGGALNPDCRKVQSQAFVQPDHLPPPGPATAWVDPDKKPR
ncbi:MAG: hypothetical protein AAB919_03960 [Patescibacteria group bacterium]